MTPPPDLDRLSDHDDRLVVARRVAQWELGDPSWANLLVGAYLQPRAAQEALDFEQGD